jgi:hypothetical protein
MIQLASEDFEQDHTKKTLGGNVEASRLHYRPSACLCIAHYGADWIGRLMADEEQQLV